MKKKMILGLVMLMAMFSLAACGGGSNVVKTDAGNVTQDELYEAMKDKYGNEFVQQLTFEKILGDKYKVTDEQVDSELKKYKSQYGDQFDAVLAQSGLTEETFKSQLKYNLLVQKATEANTDTSDKALKEYYKTWQPDITVSHILVADEAKAKEVEKKLKDGAKFADLAKEYSTDTATKENGGQLAPFGPGKMDPAFEKAAYALKNKGDISAPVKTQYGYHIIQMDKPATKTTYDKDKKAVKESYLQSQLTTENMQKTLKKEYKDADVKVEDKDLKDAFKDYDGSAKKEESTDSSK
ncbi:peptidylprolyl isomerase [Listeria ivanovii]|uniref:Foldase protein PrsA n=1 Tax=Listeria ivanovii (strain ATCC BAA-678 / PAM 55) TaxID=881621 RepID=G2ZEC2_LISIP|nr:peptidylprolyl isomerase [Listeria ivanovii]AHI56732.1 foldase PrsA [Listeria ivanovii WSLC3009]AIS66149.1 foldase [Listeria ivanovii subsp. ivanovii]MBK3913830.1 peptidylprolyl isomerase PrsA [Listeria ivanovii subsp. ivanovii]MBK3921332.1 peptidylprolyl isomerase PrsA [Listeria ivanovii subsp. ivanovii]MBK3926496.1 peptidylprolyl isomerase PrsA [Listeria ivanovii subsp. ivanovii]